ncbi:MULTISPECIES: phage tail assembly chaperone [Cronobacter]|uniref:phage tail assembly chaperone n=1 Tax=Cronobacter TaxID=413496 RepID=UPI00029C0E3D|nr:MULTISPECIES: phage tail assembly chaperone [Cronobacter]CCJ84112.1 Phage tail assembly chaperone [Cronobacter dublinensis 582]EKY3223408.1 phage tail protein [Cronobacter dublinensis]ELQ6001572.1 phage tail protein [Cronobacter turicensis]ELQ6130831.1 phage tail protein [Cronobacter turicensis]ELY2738315.1 phage tail protein [Cronobacter dublinensis]
MEKQVSQSSLRALALAPMAGFRTKVVTVPEWENATVKLREPSAQAWLEWQQVLNPKQTDGEPEELTAAERALRNKSADVILFIDVLLEEDGSQVFSEEDKPQVELFYGPVHARLLKQALDLTTSAAEVEKP